MHVLHAGKGYLFEQFRDPSVCTLLLTDRVTAGTALFRYVKVEDFASRLRATDKQHFRIRSISPRIGDTLFVKFDVFKSLLISLRLLKKRSKHPLHLKLLLIPAQNLGNIL